MKKSLKQAEGPDQETAPSLVMEKVTLKPVSSAYSDDEKVSSVHKIRMLNWIVFFLFYRDENSKMLSLSR